MRLSEKVVLVSGGARGIGAAVCKVVAREGARVALGDVLVTEGAEVEAEIERKGGEAVFVPLDVTSEDDWRRAVAATIERFGRLDVLVNNAGVFTPFSPVESASLEDWQFVNDVNAAGVFLGAKTVIPEMRKAGGGSIVNISSNQGLIGQENVHAAYNASKGAVRLLTKSTAVQYAKEGIRTNSIHPGVVSTDMTAAARSDADWSAWTMSRIPLGRYAEPEEIAYAVVYLASDESRYVTGSELVIDGGWTAQ